MAKQKKPVAPKNIIYECNKCISSIDKDNKLHCKNMIIDLNKPFSSYSEVTVKKDCLYYREIRCN